MIYGNRRGEWSKWFAWHPVTLDDGRRAWLEMVERISAYTNITTLAHRAGLSAFCYREIEK